MAVDYYSYNHNEHKVEEQEKQEEEEDDDYIDMEVSSFTQFFPLSTNTPLTPPPQNTREFEFQMSNPINVERDTSTSPADELFYMGKLLPLHLPPRLQMVEKILQDSTPKFNSEFFSTPLGTNTSVTPISGTPFESCYVSPVESCQVSRELNPEEYFGIYENGVDQKGCNNHGKKSWTKKLKTKIKSLFGKSDESYSCSAATATATTSVRKSEEGSSLKVKENPCTISQVISGANFEKQKDTKETKFCHRRSFSGAFKRRYSTTTKVSSSFSSSSSLSSSSSSLSSSNGSSNLNGLNDCPLLKRSSSANSEIEASLIQGAIAHCKKSSQEIFQGRKTLSEVGCHSFPTSRFASIDDQTSLCRG